MNRVSDFDPVLEQLALVVTESRDLEQLVRPLLELLEAVTGLESTYFTHIDTSRETQNVVYARNSRELQIPEGLTVPWGDTLCRRALEEGRNFTDDVAACWGDSGAARELGIATYLSEPVRVADGELYGTLCAASASRAELEPSAERLIKLFAQLIARQIEREWLLAQLQAENRRITDYAYSDPLTGISNRRALLQELVRILARSARDHSSVHVAFIDLDGFKAINDDYGHDEGDRFLIAMARALSSGLRGGDLVARYGGDEFVVVAVTTSLDPADARVEIAERLRGLTRGRFQLQEMVLDYAGPSIGIVTADAGERDAEALLARADEAMYQIKKQRKAGLS